ncbi:MAG: hypothetical protein A3G23_11075 [Bacteroidetes bacterium RIFCSPLOWO2_12_FULL_37_12]|nr:MAG: hypothetical protein A3G23_11075 [Bacteroidetes bacterium RIFCSPLOWO2_12_FULL_37_12]
MFKKFLSGSTLIEALISMTLITIGFVTGMMVFLNVTGGKNTERLFLLKNEMELVSVHIKKDQKFINEQINFDEGLILVEFMDYSKYLKKMKISGYNADKKLLLEWNELLLHSD